MSTCGGDPVPTSKYDAPKGSLKDRKELLKEKEGKLPYKVYLHLSRLRSENIDITI